MDDMESMVKTLEENLSGIDTRKPVDLSKPITLNYFVGPHVPDGLGTLLSPEGEPVMLEYDKVDWKGLAVGLQKLLADEGLPKAIKVYVGNDAIDLFDINRFDCRKGREVDNYDPFLKAWEHFAQASPDDYRAGVFRFSEREEGIHLNRSKVGWRPPIAGIFVSIRFGSKMQFADYHQAASHIVLGKAHMISPWVHSETVMPNCVMAKPLKSWLEKETGAVYANESTILPLPSVDGRR